MATPWRIPGTGEPGGLMSVGSHRVGHNWSDSAAAAAAAAAAGSGKTSPPTSTQPFFLRLDLVTLIEELDQQSRDQKSQPFLLPRVRGTENWSLSGKESCSWCSLKTPENVGPKKRDSFLSFWVSELALSFQVETYRVFFDKSPCLSPYPESPEHFPDNSTCDLGPPLGSHGHQPKLSLHVPTMCSMILSGHMPYGPAQAASESTLFCFQAVWLHRTSLSFCFLLCKMGMMMSNLLYWDN